MMKLFCCVTLLSLALAYYIYTPLPESISEPWKLMILDATVRSVMSMGALFQKLGICHHRHVVQYIMHMQGVAPMSSEGPQIQDTTFAGVQVRVYEMRERGGGRLRRGLVYLHGGGWVFGSAKDKSYDLLCRKMAEDLKAVIVSVEYRLVPEVHFPQQHDDCLEAAKHFLKPDVLALYSVDPDHVGVAGDSAGGNLAAAVAQQVKEAFSRSSVSCLMGTNIKFDKDTIYDPCWQVMQQLQYRIEKTMSFEKAMFNKEFNSAMRDFDGMSHTTAENHVHGQSPGIAAHLTAKVLAKEEREIERPPSNTKVLGQKIEDWETQRGLAFQNNLVTSNGELIFPQAGLYYVYSQSYFRLSQQELEEKCGQVLQYIYQKISSYPVPILLMKNARTTCWSRDLDHGLYSIYQAAVVPLSAGDRVFVTVSNISALDRDEKTSFLGAFLVI